MIHQEISHTFSSSSEEGDGFLEENSLACVPHFGDDDGEGNEGLEIVFNDFDQSYHIENHNEQSRGLGIVCINKVRNETKGNLVLL